MILYMTLCMILYMILYDTIRFSLTQPQVQNIMYVTHKFLPFSFMSL